MAANELSRSGGRRRFRFFGFGSFGFTHRFTMQFDAVGVVDQAVEDAIGQRRITNLLVPLCDG